MHPDHSSVFLSPPHSDPTFLSPSDTVSVACRRSSIICVKERKRSRKPSPARTKRLTSTEQLDQFLARGCGCATKCSAQFDRDFYLSKRDEASALTREQMDLVVLGQIQAFLSVDEVIGPSHKHTPTQRRTTRVNTFYHLGKKICRGTFQFRHALLKELEVQTSIINYYFLFLVISFKLCIIYTSNKHLYFVLMSSVIKIYLH